MLRRPILTAALTAVALCALVVRAEDKAKTELPKANADGFITLFDGKTLDNWEGLEGFWSVKDGVISGAEDKQHAAPQTFLILKSSKEDPAKFGDFEMHYSYKFATPGGNSGVQFRSKVLDAKTSRIGGYQADIDAGRGYDGTIYDEGGVAGGRGTMSNRGDKTVWSAENKRTNTPLAESNADLQKAVKLGDWNEVILIAKGNHITYTINGHLMTELTDDSPKEVKEGVIGLQLHAGFVMDVQFKDIKIKLLGDK